MGMALGMGIPHADVEGCNSFDFDASERLRPGWTMMS